MTKQGKSVAVRKENEANVKRETKTKEGGKGLWFSNGL